MNDLVRGGDGRGERRARSAMAILLCISQLWPPFRCSSPPSVTFCRFAPVPLRAPLLSAVIVPPARPSRLLGPSGAPAVTRPSPAPPGSSAPTSPARRCSPLRSPSQPPSRLFLRRAGRPPSPGSAAAYRAGLVSVSFRFVRCGFCSILLAPAPLEVLALSSQLGYSGGRGGNRKGGRRIF